MEFSEWLLNEEIYGNRGIVFHRTHKHGVSAIAQAGVKLGSGGYYGVGLYTCFDLKSQFNNYMTRYGEYLVKMGLNLDKFLILDQDVASKVYGSHWRIEDQLMNHNIYNVNRPAKGNSPTDILKHLPQYAATAHRFIGELTQRIAGMSSDDPLRFGLYRFSISLKYRIESIMDSDFVQSIQRVWGKEWATRLRKDLGVFFNADQLISQHSGSMLNHLFNTMPERTDKQFHGFSKDLHSTLTSKNSDMEFPYQGLWKGVPSYVNPQARNYANDAYSGEKQGWEEFNKEVNNSPEGMLLQQWLGKDPERPQSKNLEKIDRIKSIVDAEAGKYTSAIAAQIFPEVREHVNGLVFTGRRDGRVAVVYKVEAAKPLSYTYAPAEEPVERLDWRPLEQASQGMV